MGSEAAAEIRRIYDSGLARTYIKSDDSPVTDADLASDRIIRAHLRERFPGDAVLTEEGADDTGRLTAERCWIVDPIDGTQQFVDRTGQFDVLIALVVGGRPVVGVMIQPATGLILAAAAGDGAELGLIDSPDRRPMLLAQPNPETRVVTTIWFGAPESDPFLARFARAMAIAQPEILRTGVIVRGHLDREANGISGQTAPLAVPLDRPAHGMIGVPMRGDGTMAWEWDYAAADIVVHEAGGRFTDWHGNEFRYNKPVPRNIGGLVFGNTTAVHARMIDAIGPLIPEIEASRA